jgi:hypothetical protein
MRINTTVLALLHPTYVKCSCAGTVPIGRMADLARAHKRTIQKCTDNTGNCLSRATSLARFDSDKESSLTNHKNLPLPKAS